jgi:RNA polymerase sigma-70 factor (ECF subfamily)
MTVQHEDQLAEQFEQHRDHLRAVAYRMLGSRSEADDAVQDAYLRLRGSDAEVIENLRGWLTTVVARLCLDQLRARGTRREESLEERMPDPVTRDPDQIDPEYEALLADSVGLALLVVLDTLAPAERIAFVLHDMFAVPFEDIAPIVQRTAAATRQLASRARRRVRDVPTPDPDMGRQRTVVDAFLAAARSGDFEALVSVLDPDVVIHADAGTGFMEVVRGAENVARRARSFARFAPSGRPVDINGVAGLTAESKGRPFSILAFTVRDGRIVEMYALANPERLSRLMK